MRSELGLVKGPQDWKIGADGGHAGHHGGMAGMATMPAGTPTELPLAVFVAKARAEAMAFPVLVLPPHASQKFGGPTGEVWTLKSEAQNRWLTRKVTYNPATGTEVDRSGFGDQHVLDRIVNTGVAWHKGQLFGPANQLIGLVTALGLIAISVLGMVMWLRRRPEGSFGAPAGAPVRSRAVGTAIVLLALLLPLFGLSLAACLILDYTIGALVRR